MWPLPLLRLLCGIVYFEITAVKVLVVGLVGGLLAREFLCLFKPHRSRPILEAEETCVVSAATAHAFHGLISLRILGIEPISLPQSFAVGQFPC